MHACGEKTAAEQLLRPVTGQREENRRTGIEQLDWGGNKQNKTKFKEE
jgi:hypothetical protein